MARDSVSQTLLVATVLCVVCSVLVASSAVGLRSIQEANKRLDQKKNVLIAAGQFNEKENTIDQVDEIFAENIERNSVHGSDSPENAAQEIALCFSKDELVG